MTRATEYYETSVTSLLQPMECDTFSMEIVKRTSCRAIFLTPEEEVLLIQVTNDQWSGWITPGGGIDDGETEIESLRRELKEELGFTLHGDAPKVWKRFHKYPWKNRQIEQHEIYFLIRTNRFLPSTDVSLTAIEREEFKEIRWWPLEEIARATDVFSPRSLARHLKELVQSGVPIEPAFIDT